MVRLGKQAAFRFGKYFDYLLSCGHGIGRRLYRRRTNGFLAYKGQFEGRIGSLVDQFVQIKMLSLHAERLADTVLNETESEATPDVGIPDISDDIEISVENVSFRYADNEPYVLQNVSFKIGRGESLALIGRSGCGKSTLLDILSGNLPPESGKVMINGHDIYSLPPRLSAI